MVSDDGEGSGPELGVRLFEPFTQADTSPDRARGGLGVGLVKGRVELQGGNVQAKSEGPGRGARFTLRPAEASRRPRHILVLEDNVDAAEVLRELLVPVHHEGAVAQSGEEGLRLARQQSPYVVRCDVALPDMSGYDVARRLRDVTEGARALLVGLSGHAPAEDVGRARRRLRPPVSKPVTLATLEALFA